MRRGEAVIPVQTEVWLRHDLMSLLKSIDKANACVGYHKAGPEAAHFRAGFRAAIEAVAVAIDVPLPLAADQQVIPSIPRIAGGRL